MNRAAILICAGFQAIVSAILLHSVMSNMAPVGIGFAFGLGSGLSTFAAFGTMTLCAAFGSSPRVVTVCKFLMLVPCLIFGLMLLSSAASANN